MTTKEAIRVEGQPQGEDGTDCWSFAVGFQYGQMDGTKWRFPVGTVSRITVTDDLPGLHCNMERIRVYDGETVIAEMPMIKAPALTRTRGKG